MVVSHYCICSLSEFLLMMTDPQNVHFLYQGKIAHLIGIVPNFLKLGVEIAFQYST